MEGNVVFDEGGGDHGQPHRGPAGAEHLLHLPGRDAGAGRRLALLSEGSEDDSEILGLDLCKLFSLGVIFRPSRVKLLSIV